MLLKVPKLFVGKREEPNFGALEFRIFESGYLPSLAIATFSKQYSEGDGWISLLTYGNLWLYEPYPTVENTVLPPFAYFELYSLPI